MVSYYNPSVAQMFSRASAPHPYHHHHSTQSQSPYFNSAAAAYGGYHHGHPHQQGSGGSPVGSALGVGVGSSLTGVGGVSSAQFSPNMGTDFNCTHPQFNPHPYANMGADPMTGAAWHQQYSSACAAARSAALAAPHPGTYEDWTNVNHTVPSAHHPHVHPHHPSFYHHTQPSPPSSTPSPNSSHPGGSQTPNNHAYSNSAPTPNNNNNSSITMKTEFGPFSGGNPQENNSQEMNGQGVVTSGGTPHSPDSGMAISDGVSSSGSPANGQYPNNCLGGPSSSGNGSANSNNNVPTSTALGSNESNNGPHQNSMLHNGSHNLLHSNQHHHHHHPLSINQGASNLNHPMAIGSHQSPLINVSAGRPTQARSPYEWMKKQASFASGGSSTSSNAKTRTKDKYRVVYSDTQRLELEKEFHYSRYITIRRKAELASMLGLSERQVKIWFQNRRAKERKVVRKREEGMQREKINVMNTMVHMQNVGMMNPMCNQPNGLPTLM